MLRSVVVSYFGFERGVKVFLLYPLRRGAQPLSLFPERASYQWGIIFTMKDYGRELCNAWFWRWCPLFSYGGVCDCAAWAQ